jgi:hypothetical protein
MPVFVYECFVAILFYFAAVGFLNITAVATWYLWLRRVLLTNQPEKLKEGFTLDTFHESQLSAYWISVAITGVCYGLRYWYVFHLRKSPLNH